jgi:hypothetical protein
MTLKYKIEDLKKFAKDHDGECLSDEYITCNEKYTWKCNKCGNIINRKWSNMNQLQTLCKCRKHYTIEDLKQHAINKNGKCLSNKYIYANDNYEWKCNKCGNIWKTTWRSIINNNTWCKTCSIINRSINSKIRHGKINEKDKNYIFTKKIKKYNRKMNLNPNPNITSGNACKLIACKPARDLWEEIYRDNTLKFTLQAYEKIKQTIIDLEEKMHKNNKYAKKSMVVALAIHINTKASKEQISNLCNITPTSIRNLKKKLNM